MDKVRASGTQFSDEAENKHCIKSAHEPFTTTDPFLFQKKSTRQAREEKSKVSTQSGGSDTATSPPAEKMQATNEFLLSASAQSWAKEGSAPLRGGFPGFSGGDALLQELEDGQFDQEDGVTQVTCM